MRPFFLVIASLGLIACSVAFLAFLPPIHAITVGGGLTLGTDIEFYLPDNNTVVSWPAPLMVDYFNISTDSVTFVNASFDGINAHTFTISVSGGNASIVAITKDYVEVVLNAPAGTVSKVAFHAVRPVLTVRAISGAAEEVMQDSEFFRDRAAWLRASAPATLLTTDGVEVKVVHHSPVTVFFYFVRYSPPAPAAVGGTGGGGGGLPVNPPVTPLPAPPQGLPPAANVGLGIIILSVAGAALYSEVRKRRRIPTLFRARYRYKPVKWGKRTKKWWEE